MRNLSRSSVIVRGEKTTDRRAQLKPISSRNKEDDVEGCYTKKRRVGKRRNINTRRFYLYSIAPRFSCTSPFFILHILPLRTNRVYIYFFLSGERASVLHILPIHLSKGFIFNFEE